MRLGELDYELPVELIAQQPLEQREEARLMVLDRSSDAVEHSRFRKLGRYLADGDLLVLNDTRVFPARLFARKESGGRVELVFVRSVAQPPGAWLALTRAHHAPGAGSRLVLEDGRALRVVAYERPGRPILVSEDGATLETILMNLGILALPPYIRRPPAPGDGTAYQTVYADKIGAVAAPTAGLHFTTELLDELRGSGVHIAFLTLHIGPGTFVPLREPLIESHSMEAEWYSLDEATIGAIELARRTGARVVAVGTSTVRALESFAITGDREGFTGLFVRPGFRFRLTDSLITNFHAPRSTVLAMVMALAGRERILHAYQQAIRHRYRFFSYGDAMLIR